MEAERCKEILESSKKIEVMFGSHSIWIDDVDLSTRTASIHMKEDPSDKKTVSTDLLKEH
ncbi:H-type small acid-soluble spore protein [Longirhabdus pacifica]|uniref:H-type small acid-soluble spore protein n=1 Tax=Longirhabdus pacifica TaxID=2305227 RepID=UPI001008CEC0|nr:H-type small acid-soluble spore protein [Longirhabdus pacifica]